MAENEGTDEAAGAEPAQDDAGLQKGLPFELSSGGCGEVVAFAALRTWLISPAPFPPGSTLRGNMPGIACPLEVKVKGCKRLPGDGPARFSVEGRLQNATREMLSHLGGLPEQVTPN